MSMQEPLIISFFTKNSAYEREAEGFAKSCQRWGLSYYIEAKDSLSSWGKNCCLKPNFILEQLQMHQRPIVWLDIDARVLQKPTLFFNLQADVALRVNEDLPQSDESRVLSGTFFINPTKNAEIFLKRWTLYCEQEVSSGAAESGLSDQRCLIRAYDECKKDLVIYPLPNSYITIVDMQRGVYKEDIVIAHQQASRYFHRGSSLTEKVEEQMGPLSAAKINMLLGVDFKDLGSNELEKIRDFLSNLEM